MASKNTETYAHIGYPDFGWRQDSGILVPVYFEVQSASHLVNIRKVTIVIDKCVQRDVNAT